MLLHNVSKSKNSTDYKSCPIKKRPVIYERDKEDLAKECNVEGEQMEPLALIKTASEFDQPQDLSLKRKVGASFEDYSVTTKRQCVLNLSKKSLSVTSCSPYVHKKTSESPAQDLPSSCVMLSPPSETDSVLEYRPNDIHLRELSADTNSYDNNPYKSAFVRAAGFNPMIGLWNTYQHNNTEVFPSPASSIISSAYPRSANSYTHITPPSSPGTGENCKPEDLSMRYDIPLTALCHSYNESSSYQSSNSSTSSAYSRNSSIRSTSSNTKNYRFKCDKCNKMYSTSMGLSKHQQFHCAAAECNQEKKQHACQECGKLYNTTGALKMHIRTHTLPCKCPICGKAFSRPWLLQGHIRTHTGERPFQCSDCPRSFADRSNLRAHEQTHADVKKYACKVCSKSFSRMSLLQKHANSSCSITIV